MVVRQDPCRPDSQMYQDRRVKTYSAKHFFLKSSAREESVTPEGIGGACLEEYS